MTSSIPTNTPSLRRKHPPPRVVEVRRVTQLTPCWLRITFGGEQMAGFEATGPAEHIRVYMPDSETGELLLPVMGTDGYDFPEGRQPSANRAYTVRRWDSETGELDLDIFLHDKGPGPVWAAGLKEGDLAVIFGPPVRTYFPNMDADWYLFGGDEAALPSSMRAYVLAEVRDADEELELKSAAALQLRWLYRKAGEMPGRALVSAMREVVLPEGKGFVYVTCEVAIMREIRKHFIEERRFDRSMLRMQGYWKAGAADAHDKGEDL